MKLLFTLGWLPLVVVLFFLAAPVIGGVVHTVFFLEYLTNTYGRWAEYLFGIFFIVLFVFSINYKDVFLFGLLPLVVFMCWFTS